MLEGATGCLRSRWGRWMGGGPACVWRVAIMCGGAEWRSARAARAQVCDRVTPPGKCDPCRCARRPASRARTCTTWRRTAPARSPATHRCPPLHACHPGASSPATRTHPLFPAKTPASVLTVLANGQCPCQSCCGEGAAGADRANPPETCGLLPPWSTSMTPPDRARVARGAPSHAGAGGHR